MWKASEAGDVAVAIDPATGDLYIDDQSSVAEWDTGAMNRNGGELSGTEGTLVSRFGSLQLSGSSGQGGIAVNGESGKIYVSNPADGKVYVFGSDAPAVTAGEAADVTKEDASLSGTVDPRGVAVSSCEFEYGVTDEFGNGPYNHSVSCQQTSGEIGAGSSPVAVSAQIEGLKPGVLYHFRLNASNANGAGPKQRYARDARRGLRHQGFEVNFLNENGTPDTQAGSHPYEFVNNFKLNSQFKRKESNADSPYIREPEGVLRNLKIDLPPGFVGDPNATPRSAPERNCVRNETCPAESILGTYILELAESTASLIEHREQPLQYGDAARRGVAARHQLLHTPAVHQQRCACRRRLSCAGDGDKRRRRHPSSKARW